MRSPATVLIFLMAAGLAVPVGAQVTCIGGGCSGGSSSSGIGSAGTGASTAADDTVPVSDGSNWAAKALPDCTDTGGNHLNYTASSNGFSCGTSGGSALPVVDTTGISKGSSDATKILRFEVDGFTTGTTRVLTPQNRDGTVADLGANTFTGVQKGPDGTVSVPTWSFANGTNSGVYLYSTQTGIALAANGNNEIIVIPNYTMFRNVTQIYGSTTNLKFLDTADPGASGTGNFVGITRDSAFTLRITDGGSLNGAGYGYLYASRKIIPKTTAYTVVVAEGNGIYTNEGATASVTFTLPSAAAGMGPFTFIVQDSDGLSVVAAAGDTIRLNTSVSATAGNAACSTIGCVITLSAINATEWIATAHEGTWTIT